ncbi:MAG: efflux RND transporter periplasmic adaptor subunit [Duncaniella sp.]|nr:efflux RND transporter periplasmic adaptor subunit [Duncaniella sp.]
MKRCFRLSLLVLVLSSCHSQTDYDATGIFEATTVTVSAETAGKILSFPAVEGDSVREGETIATIDTVMLVLQQNQLMSQRRATESSSPDVAAQAAALRQQIAHQQGECERFGRLLADGATTQKQYDDARAHLKVLNGQLSALISTLDKNRTSISDNAVALEYQIGLIDEQIAKSKIVSPLTGTMLEKYAETGEYAVTGRPLCKLADLNKIYLRAYFTALQLARIKLGQKVTVIADFGGDEQFEYPGTVAWIAQESEFTPKSIQTRDTRANLVYAVKIRVMNDGRLKLGQYGEVKL